MYLKMAYIESIRSQCLKLQGGAILVNPEEKIIGLGYNSPPIVELPCEKCLAISSHCERAVHAEEKAIGTALSSGYRIDGSTLYCTHKPCIRCCEKIRSFRVAKIVYINGYEDKRGNQDEILEGIEVIQSPLKEVTINGYQTGNEPMS